MGYNLHIERESEPISLEDWKRAASGIEGSQLLDADRNTVNPATGEVIKIKASDGDLEISLPPSFSECITYRRGKGTFRARGEYEDSANPIRQVIARLAKSLGAKIIGDEGEVYEW